MSLDTKLCSPVRVKLERMSLKTPVKQSALSSELRKVINDRNILTGNSRKKILFELQKLEEMRQAEDKQNTLHEILTSELAYINQIELIQEFFMGPIFKQKLITSNEFDFVFGNITSIYKVNGALLDELKEDLMHLTMAFNRMAPFFKLYSEYAFNFKNAMDTLNDLIHNNPEFKKFVQGQETRPEVQHKLTSLLIAPIQRIPRYCLLIKQVLDNTGTNDEDYHTLKETYEKLNSVAKHIDSAVQQQQNYEQILLLAKRLKDGKTLIIKPGRKLIKHTPMKMFTKNKEIDIYLILLSDILMFCTLRKSNHVLANSLKCMSIFPLRKCIVKQNKNMMIVVRCEDEEKTIYSDQGYTEDWIIALKSTLREYITNRSTLRKGSSSRRPAMHFNFEAYQDHGVSPGVRGIRKRRCAFNYDEIENQEAELSEAPENTSEIKKPKLVESRKSIRTLIPRFAACSKKLGKFGSYSKSKSANAMQGTIDDKKKENNAVSDTEKKDALFPLREHFINIHQPSGDSCALSTSNVMPYTGDVYIFGNENNRESSFSFSSLFNVFSKTVKRAFGFK